MKSLLSFPNILRILFLSSNLCFDPTFFNQYLSKRDFTSVQILSLTPTPFSSQAGRKAIEYFV